jgi:hypothetical protein
MTASIFPFEFQHFFYRKLEIRLNRLGKLNLNNKRSSCSEHQSYYSISCEQTYLERCDK